MNLVRSGLFGVITFAVLSHGAVEPWARAVLECAAGALMVLWAVEFFYAEPPRPIVLPQLLFPMAAFSLVVLVQWTFGLTASRFSTGTELRLWLCLVILVFLAAQVLQSLADWRKFAWFTMLLAFFVAGLGILQHLTFNGKLYWFREMHYGGIPFGPFVNRNHFAGFAELVLPISLVPLLLGRVRKERLVIVSILALIPVAALLLSASRGGIISLGAELAFLLVVLVLKRAHGRATYVAGAVLLGAFALASWLGVNQILARFASLQYLEVTEGKRASMRHGTWRIFSDHPVLGTGLATLQQVYPPYETLYDGRIVNHAHNDYLETLAETGVLGGVCWAWFLGVLFVGALRFLKNEGDSFANTLRLCGWTACCGLLVHSLVDFNLHIPSNLLLFLTMSLLATAEMSSPRSSEAPGSGRSRRRVRSRRHDAAPEPARA